jgi:hypothetical protein
MFLSLQADKDTYITNKFVKGVQVKSGNVGAAGTLDLFKLYGVTQLLSGGVLVPQTELSRILLHFNLDKLRSAVSAKKIDVNDSSFKCQLKLKDVYGGQTTPINFTIDAFPLSASFSEGLGRDTAYYVDEDKANFLSASKSAAWYDEGCSLACFSTGSGDYITSSISIPSTRVSQYFENGDEDLLLDVTQIVSATIAGELPDSGFRLSFTSEAESDGFTYFVKRFASRHAYNEALRPRLLVKFDDSTQDDSANLFLDSPNDSNIFLYNYVNGELTNLLSASSTITGSSCVFLDLKTEVSGVGQYVLTFTGSQHSLGSNFVTGVYKAPVSLPLSNQYLRLLHLQSGSIDFTPVWKSLDSSVAYVTGSALTARSPVRTNHRLSPRRYTVNVLGVNSDYSPDEDVTLNVNIFDDNDPIIVAKRLPFVLPGVVQRNSYYAIRNAVTNAYEIPFDTVNNSTKLSSDSRGMYFKFNTSALTPLQTYAVDVMIVVDGMQHKYANASPTFRITGV